MSDERRSILASIADGIFSLLARVFGGWARDFVARPVSFLVTAVFVGAGVFAYSYIPLHAADARRIERLESELESQTTRAVDASSELAKLQAETRERPDPEALRALVAENDEQRRKLEKMEDEVAYARKRVRSLESQRNKARKQLKTAESERKILADDMASLARAAPEPAAPAPAPAAPAPEPDLFELAPPAPGPRQGEAPPFAP